MKSVFHNAEGRVTGVIEYAEGSTALMLDKMSNECQPIGNVDLRVEDVQLYRYTSSGVVQRESLTLTPGLAKQSIIADRMDAFKLDGLPKGTVINVESHDEYKRVVVDDGVFELVTSLPGEYKISVDPFPYRPFEVTVNAA